MISGSTPAPRKVFRPVSGYLHMRLPWNYCSFSSVMLLISYSVNSFRMLSSVHADCIQASVSGCLCSNSLSVKGRCYLCRNASIFLLEMHFIDTIWFYNILKCRFKQIKDFIWMEFFMTVIGNSFCCIPIASRILGGRFRPYFVSRI